MKKRQRKPAPERVEYERGISIAATPGALSIGRMLSNSTHPARLGGKFTKEGQLQFVYETPKSKTAVSISDLVVRHEIETEGGGKRVEIVDSLKGHRGPLRKTFDYLLARTHESTRRIQLSADDLVAAGIYKSKDTARRSLDAIMPNLPKIIAYCEIEDPKSKEPKGRRPRIRTKTTREWTAIFPQVIQDGPGRWVVTCWEKPEEFNYVPLIMYATSAPAWVMGLPNKSKAYELAILIFSRIRQAGLPTRITAESVQAEMCLPTVEELGGRRWAKQRITTPIETAVAAIEEAQGAGWAQGDPWITITPEYSGAKVEALLIERGNPPKQLAPAGQDPTP